MPFALRAMRPVSSPARAHVRFSFWVPWILASWYSAMFIKSFAAHLSMFKATSAFHSLYNHSILVCLSTHTYLLYWRLFLPRCLLHHRCSPILPLWEGRFDAMAAQTFQLHRCFGKQRLTSRHSDENSAVPSVPWMPPSDRGFLTTVPASWLHLGLCSLCSTCSTCSTSCAWSEERRQPSGTR